MEKDVLLEKAFKAMDNAYAPYSNYRVGSCVALSDGNYIIGANVENCSYPAGICGERNAIFSAYAQGYRKEDVEAIAIVTSGWRVGAPCGVCRQVLSECLKPETPIILSNGKETIETNIKELLPMSFSEEDLQ